MSLPGVSAAPSYLSALNPTSWSTTTKVVAAGLAGLALGRLLYRPNSGQRQQLAALRQLEQQGGTLTLSSGQPLSEAPLLPFSPVLPGFGPLSPLVSDLFGPALPSPDALALGKALKKQGSGPFNLVL